MLTPKLEKFALRTASIYRRLKPCDKGIAALEFGYVVPIMAMMFVGTVELSQAITVDRRVSQIASSTADLVARQKSVTETTLDGYMLLIDQLMKPYDENLLKLTISNIYATVAAPTTPLVCWSYSRKDGAVTKAVSTYTKGQNFTGLPTGIVEGGTSVIVVEAQYDYVPLIFNTYITTTLPMRETFYLKPRLSASVTYGTDAACV